MSRSVAPPNGLPSNASLAPQLGARQPLVTLRPRSSMELLFGEGSAGVGRQMLIAILLVAGIPITTVIVAKGAAAALTIAAVFAAALALTLISERSLRIEWDGRELVQRSIGRRRVIGVAGEGKVICAQLDDGVGPTVDMQYWIGAGGKVRGELHGRQWDLAALRAIAEQARCAIDDVGTTSHYALLKNHPETTPKAQRFMAMRGGPPPARKPVEPESARGLTARDRMSLGLALVVVLMVLVYKLTGGS